MAKETLIGRQPIFDDLGGMYAYELLFRTAGAATAQVTDDRYATSKVLADTLNTFGLNQLVGDKKAFINVDRDFLMDDVVTTIPKERFVLEILETVDVDPVLIDRVASLKEMGYTIAIDDLDFEEEQIANFEPLFQYVSILKIDLMATKGLDRVEEKLKAFSKYDLEYLAEKVETDEEYQACKKMGFSYYQGFFFAKPSIVEGKKLDPSKATVLELIRMLQAQEEVGKIEQTFGRSPDLAFNLLRYMNSSAMATRNKIGSIPQAINMLGRLPLAQWLTLFLYADDKEEGGCNPLMESAMLRAELMAAFARRFKGKKEQVDKAYLTGLLSMLDVILHISLEQLFNEMDFDEEIKGAVLGRNGTMGKLLTIVTVVEKGDFTKTGALLAKLNMSADELSAILSRCFAAIYANCAPPEEKDAA